MKLKVAFFLLLIASIGCAQENSTPVVAPVEVSQPQEQSSAASPASQPQEQSSAAPPASQPQEQSSAAPSASQPQEQSSAPPPASQPQEPSSIAAQPPSPQPSQAPPEERQGGENNNTEVTQAPSPTTAASTVARRTDIHPTAIPSSSPLPTHTTPTTTPTTPRPTTPTPIAPTPPSFPQNIGKWSVNGTNPSPCLVVEGAFQIHLKGNATLNTADKIVDVPNAKENVTITGKCDADRQKLQISWWSQKENATKEGSKYTNSSLDIEFSKTANGQYALSFVKYRFIDGSTNRSGDLGGSFFLTDLQHSFRCKSNEHLETDGGTLMVFTENLQFEAFRDDTKSEETVVFSTSDDCKADHRVSTGVILTIGVGIGILILIVIVLGMYLLKRCRRSDYQTLDNER